MNDVLNFIPSGYLSFTDDGYIQEANRVLGNWLGWADEDLVGQHIDTIFSPGARIYYQVQFFPTLRLHGSQEEVYLSIKTKSGDEVPVLVNAQRQDRDGTPLNVCILMRMHRRQQFEDDIIRARNELDREQQRLNAILHNIQIGVVVCDDTGAINLFNQAAVEYLGVSPSLPPERWPDHYRLYDADGGRRLAVKEYPLRRALFGEVVKDEEFMVVPTGGEPRTLLVSGTAFTNARGRKLGVVLAFKNITERKALEENLRRTNKDLEDYAYVSSHDLQEPLRKVSLYVQLLLEECGDINPDAQQHAEFILAGVQRMQLIIKDLLAYSRTIHQGAEETRPRADLNQALQEALVSLEPPADDQYQITSDELPEVQGDERQLSLVLQNLLSNALKYRVTGREPRVHVSARPETDSWIISVRDNGIGFDPRYAERIFGLFKRLYKDEFAGTGIGLAICRRILERYGGEIWASSDGEGKGACFEFRLPKSNGELSV